MSTKSIILAIYLKWLTIKKRFIKLLPVSASKKLTMLNTLKLRQIAVKSKLQQAAARELFGPYSKGIVFNTTNGVLINSVEDVQVNRYLGNNGSYNMAEINVLLSLINSSSTVYIVGTHIGTLVVPFAKKTGLVVGFEANPATFELLNLNIALNSLTNVRVYNYAIFDKQTSLSFYQSKANSGGSKIKPAIDDFKYNYDNPEVITVEGDTLDNLARKYNLPYPDFIIMDIEGAEYFALKGAGKCLQHAQGVYIEYVPHHLKNVANVSLQDFYNLLTPYFNTMKIIDEEIKNENKQYSGAEILLKLESLFNKETSADLLLLKGSK